MPIGILFWALMIIALVFRVGVWRWQWGGARGPVMSDLFIWFLFFLVGWAVFGFILQGGRGL
jgi:hypothetical protein